MDGIYPTFNFHVAACGGQLTKVPFRDDKEDIGVLLDAAWDKSAKIMYLSNPDNPMGTWWSASDLEQAIADLPDGTVFVLD